MLQPFGHKNKDGKNTYKSYDELTKEEKLRVPIISPPVKHLPTQAQLDAWRLDAEKFGVWIGAHRIKNEDLKNYNPKDFGYYLVSGLEKNAKNYGILDYEVHLMMLTVFEEFRNEILEKYKID